MNPTVRRWGGGGAYGYHSIVTIFSNVHGFLRIVYFLLWVPPFGLNLLFLMLYWPMGSAIETWLDPQCSLSPMLFPLWSSLVPGWCRLKPLRLQPDVVLAYGISYRDMAGPTM